MDYSCFKCQLQVQSKILSQAGMVVNRTPCAHGILNQVHPILVSFDVGQKQDLHAWPQIFLLHDCEILHVTCWHMSGYFGT